MHFNLKEREYESMEQHAPAHVIAAGSAGGLGKGMPPHSPVFFFTQ